MPFRLPELIADIAADYVIFIVEGEKDVNTLRARNIPATCNPMGAGKWWPEFNKILRDADVVICGDNDQPGRDHVALVAKNLHGAARRIRILDLKRFWPEIDESDDISDWFEARHSVEQLWSFVDQLEDWHPSTNGHDDAPPFEDREPNTGADENPDSENTDAKPRTPWSVPALAWRDPAVIPQRVFLYGHYYARGFVSA